MHGITCAPRPVLARVQITRHVYTWVHTCVSYNGVRITRQESILPRRIYGPAMAESSIRVMTSCATT